PPRRANDKVPRDLETICLKALAKEPARRYHTARAVADDLRRWLNGEPIQARPVGWLGQLGRWVRRHKTLAGSVAAACAILTAVAVAYGFIAAARSRAAEAQERANEQHRVAQEMQRLRGIADRERAYAKAQETLARNYLYMAHMILAQ